jgi:hypothetical protein
MALIERWVCATVDATTTGQEKMSEKGWVDRSLTLAERVIALIRPRFYNRVAWVIIVAGLVLMATPWWYDLLVALTSRHLNVTLPRVEAPYGWGFALVALGLIYHLLVHHATELIQASRDAVAGAAQREHDKRIFEEFRAKLPERALGHLLRDLRDNHHFYSAQDTAMDEAIQHLLTPDTQFISEEVKIAGRRFGIALAEFREWRSLHFYPHGAPYEGEQRYCLHPDLHEDRASEYPSHEDQKRYSAFADSMYALLGDVESKYADFRATVKRVLAI